MFRLQYANNFKHKTCFKKIVGTWNEKQQKLDLKNLGPKNIHITSKQNFPVAVALPIPENIDASETTRFSPYRARDISATVLSQSVNVSNTHFDFTNSSLNLKSEGLDDKHVQSYDCFGAVSLNSAMQSNVPSPFGGMHKFSHLNMPGGQWSQDCKFMSQNLQDSHYTSLRRNARSNWTQYDQNAVINKKTEFWNAQSTRQFSYKNDKEQTPTELTKKEQLKKAFKEYGSTVIVFHVAISLISLEICYLLVSGGIDVMPILEYCGLASTALSNKIAVGASTFVIAYAIHKVFAPIRIGITLAVTPFIVRYLRKKGFLKPTSIK